MHPDQPPDDDACYRALQARDARFDGCFFTGVTSTGIYCRPVCAVKTPQRGNCRFFQRAAQAEHAGFRPCLRCRPELAPQTRIWSLQDATAILAHQAAQLLDDPTTWTDSPSVQALADRLGVSDRHLRRIFEAHLGVSPLQYLQTRRLLTAKQLLTDTRLPVAQVAQTSGFASVRRFNAVWAAHYGLSPSQLRRNDRPPATPRSGMAIRLGYRPPYDVQALLGFLQTRQINAIESIATHAGSTCVASTFYINSGGHAHRGWLTAEYAAQRHHVLLRVSDSLLGVLPQVICRVRAWLDLDADPHAIHSVLHSRFPGGDGLRVPGTLDGFALAVRAVLGQQITVAAARTLAQRVVDAFGEPIDTPLPGLTRLFPTPAALAVLPGEALGQLGIVRQRQAAILGLARAVADGQIRLDPLHSSSQVHTTVEALTALPGIGDWTAQYIAMRALRWPDAFPAGDGALHKALGLQNEKNPARAAEAAALPWKPWRSYAVLRAWATLAPSSPLPEPPAANSLLNT